MDEVEERPSVFVVDDDPQILRALARGLTAEGFAVRSWESADAFLSEHDPDAPGVLIADVAMPGLGGLELQALLSSSGRIRPVVFVTGKGSIPMTVQAMRAGAVSFLEKPVHLAELVAAVREAIELDRRARDLRARRAAVEARITSLTPRERQVLALVLAGKLNKQIAAQLGTAEKTVKVHRGRLMRKMRVRSVAELAAAAAAASID